MSNNISWFNRAKDEAQKKLPLNERIVGIAIVVFCVLMIIYFISHQIRSTGFFTSEFGPFETFLFYGFWIFWITTAGLEAVLSQRLPSRIVDTFGGIIFATVSIGILLVFFPFEFAYLADVLPDSIRFLVQWISNDIARVIMVLLMIGHLIAAIYSPIAYKFIDVKALKRKKSN